MKKRQSNFELLRIVAMCMIIAMHYITKGMSIPKLSVDSSVRNHFYWLVYAFCLVAVNVYVLISGYFLVDSEWHISKVIKLWIEVLVYSILIPLVLGALGVISISEISFGNWQQILLPVEYEHYWFATAYVMMFLLSPVLSMAVKHMSMDQLRNVILALLVVFCGFKSINPYLIPWDRYGCDFAWFICLFLIAGYIRLYGIKFFSSMSKSVLIYVIATLATFVICSLYAVIVRATGKLEYSMDMTYAYNYVTVLIASVAMFYVFLYMADSVNSSKLCPAINKLAGCTFGVYLIHENILIRERWSHWLGIDNAQGTWWQILHMIFCIIVIFIVCAFIDMVRDWIFKAFSKKR